MYSKTKPGLKATNDIERSPKERQLVALAAAACAEHLNDTYMDQLDPDQAAITTEKIFDDMMTRQLTTASLET